MDKVFIDELSLLANIGAYDWEKGIQQKLVISLEMTWDNRAAGNSDNLEFALDYAQVSQKVTALVASKHFELIEAVAEEIAALVLSEFKAPSVKVRVNKPGAVAAASNVAVMIERSS
ncbi:dihydroneopterin aldolase [Alginatibacterium sediminis]|uniref:7,8-dihydroneopterin aldolase n=1 Tax=Alginatibacterium sediminis TaxID=2164068 RepID=A0A420ECN6_9ALTE|nr:dihydroneopterin aldolase [Alginatibacterium sediminis]RKF18436.1 dihydroneopterin aldolase [Alginatibacterium sediminis]